MHKLGADGVRRWIDVRQEWERALNPLLGRLYADSATVDVALLQTGVAMESLGYITGRAAGQGKQKAASRALKEVIQEVFSAVPPELYGYVTDPLDVFAKDAADAYNGVKHADKPLPNGRWAWIVSETFALVLRAHIFRALGVSDEALLRMTNSWGWHQVEKNWAQHKASSQ